MGQKTAAAGRRRPVLQPAIPKLDRLLASFSGGKDSMLAVQRAREAGLEVRWLLAMLEETGQRLRSHGVPLALMQAQADALGLELVTAAASWDDYQATFVAQLQAMAARGAQAAVFGDIDLQAHRDWEEKVCAQAGLQAHLPLWGQPRRALVDAFLAQGWRARVVCVDSRFLHDGFAGREFDADFVASLPAGVDACGENGEFHTFVFDGPAFAHPVAHRVTGVRAWTSPARFGAVRYCFAELELAHAA
ncbi:MAG: diphthine--ammonia ligase [Pseudomonadota bacterium]